MIQRAHKIKLRPTKSQEVLLRRTAGDARYAYNWGLAKWEELYHRGEGCSAYTLSKLWTEERPEWAKETSRKAQVRSFMHVEGAFKAFFRKQHKYPKKKKKNKCKDCFYVGNDEGKLYSNRRVQLPRIGHVKMREEFRYSDARIRSLCVSSEADGWYVSIQCELSDDRPTPPESVVGVDVGIKCWAVASDGTKLDPPKRVKHLKRILAKRQRLLSRKQKGSSNSRRAANKVARTYQTIRRISLDAIHKFTTTLAKKHSTIVVEDLNVAGMQKSKIKSIRRGLSNSEMSAIISLLAYKAHRRVKVSRFYPSSKTCSNCGNVKKDLTLSDRKYHCDACHITIDRDLNAALNLRNKGLEIIAEGHSESLNDCGERTGL